MMKTSQLAHKPAEYGSDVIVDLLKACDIEYVALNPGYSFRGIHESLVNYGGNIHPEVIQCCHEEIAVAIAHGYAKATGRPMAAIVHNVVGLQHATMAIYNAWCDRAPVIVLGGNGPMDITKRRPYTDWVHSALIPGNLVRDFVKWDDQPYGLGSVPESFMRAYKVAMTPPRGPVYVCYDVDMQEERLSQPVTLPDVAKYRPPVPIEPNQDALRKAARWLVEAENPVIIADSVCRSQQATESLVELAQLLAIPVLNMHTHYLNIVPHHPLNVTGAEKEMIERADVILALDTVDPFSLAIARPSAPLPPGFISPQTRVVQISLAQLGGGSWACDFMRLPAVDLDILADTSLALQQLVILCQEIVGQDTDMLGKYSQRFERIRTIHERLTSQWKEQAAKKRDEIPISVSRFCADIGEVIRAEDWVLVNSRVWGWEQRLWDWTRPNQWLGHSGGGGLGFGIGASLGAALAYRDSNKLCVDIESDGELLYVPSALWTAAHHQIPLLIVMYNNRSYFNSQDHCRLIAKRRGRPETTSGIGNSLNQPPVDFAKLAQSFGIYAEGTIEKPENLRPALERARKVVMEKRVPALVDVVTQPR